MFNCLSLSLLFKLPSGSPKSRPSGFWGCGVTSYAIVVKFLLVWFQDSNTPVIPQVWSPACDPHTIGLVEGGEEGPIMGHIMGDARLHRWWKVTDRTTATQPLEVSITHAELRLCRWPVTSTPVSNTSTDQFRSGLAGKCLVGLPLPPPVVNSNRKPPSVDSPPEPDPSLGSLHSHLQLVALLTSFGFCTFLFQVFHSKPLIQAPSPPSFKVTLHPLNSLFLSPTPCSFAHTLSVSHGRTGILVTFLLWANTTTKAT